MCVIEVGDLGRLVGRMATIKENGKQAVIVGVTAYINELGIKSLKVRLHRDKKQLRTIDEIEI